MGLFDWLTGQFIDVIEWLDDTHDTMVYRFERHGNEIKNGAKLIVRPGQRAIFVSEGKIADELGPGTYELTTKNLPILTDLQHWDHGFRSPFKAEVYFVSTARFTDLRWGTKQPIILQDPQLGPVRVRAFGSYEIRITEPKRFLQEIVGTDGYFTLEEIKGQLDNLILSNLPAVLAKSGVTVLELARHYKQLGERLKKELKPYFERYGLSLEGFYIENVSLPEEVQKALDERSSMTILSDMDEYLRYKSAQGIAQGGSASDMVGLGAGMAAASHLFDAKHQTPPPIPKKLYYVAKEGKPTGPYSIEALRHMVKQKELHPYDLVWQEGMKEWQPANIRLKELFDGQKG